MTAVHIVIGVLALALNLAAGVWGAICWWQRRSSPVFWTLLRGGQAAIIVEALIGGVLMLIGRKVSSLHLVYGLVPIALSVFAEQFRISAAQMILDSRGFASAEEVGTLPADEQRAIVRAVVRREVGVMALSALVATVLVIRAAMVH